MNISIQAHPEKLKPAMEEGTPGRMLAYGISAVMMSMR